MYFVSTLVLHCILLAFENSIPHGLLMITVAEGIDWLYEMAVIENTSTLYVSDLVAK